MFVMLLASPPGSAVTGLAPADLATQPRDRVVAVVDDALLQRNDRVVGDPDLLGAHLRTALRDVAEPEPHLRLEQGTPVVRVERVHLELGVADEHAWPGKH